jgi:hypothetical protein
MKAFRRANRVALGSSSTATLAPGTSLLPSREMIAQRAYQKWLVLRLSQR